MVLTSKDPMRLDFNHRSVHQYLAANLQGDSLDKARIRRTVLQCLVADMRRHWSGIRIYNQFEDHDTERLATLIRWIGELDEITQQSCFPWLEEMEQHLFRLSDNSLLIRWPDDVDTSEEDPNLNSKLDLEAKRGPYWILVLSVFGGLASYTEWALSRSTYTGTWLITIQAQAAILDFFLYVGFDLGHVYSWGNCNRCSPLRILFLERPDRRRIIDPNGVFSTRSCGQVSIW